MKRLLAALAGVLLTACAQPAAAWFPHGTSGGGGGGYVIAGSGTQPSPVQGPGISTYNDITPINYGASGDFGYSLPAVARWLDVPLMEVGTSGVAGSYTFIADCHHAPTDAELVSGIGDNATDMLVRIDGGGWYKITARTADPHGGAGNYFAFVVNSSNFTDGVHRVDGICEESTGVATILEGPLESRSGNYTLASTGSTSPATIDNGAGTAGHILTLGAGSNFRYGWAAEGVGVAANSFIDGDSTTNATACAAETGSNCTGAGGAGTYHLTGAAQRLGANFTASISTVAGVGVLNVTAIANGTISPALLSGAGLGTGVELWGGAELGGTACGGSACTGTGGTGTYKLGSSFTIASEAMSTGIPVTAGDFKSFYFVTDYNNTLSRGTHQIYLCAGTCGAVTGSDSNSGATALLPVATTKAARGKIYANGSGGGAFGAYGGVICVMGGLSITTDGGVGNDPNDANGFLHYVAANLAPCSVAGDPGWPVMSFPPASGNRSYGNLRVWFTGIIADGGPNTLGGASDPTQIVLEQSKEVGKGLNFDSVLNSVMGQGGYAMLESVSFINKYSATANLVRNSTLSYASEDGMHGPPVVIGNTTVGVGPNWNFGIQGAATSGSNQLVISGLPSISGVPAGLQTLDRWFYVGATSTDGISMANGCFDGATVTSVNNATSTLTMSTTATCSGTSAMAWKYSAQPHGDNIQFQSGSQANDVIIADNTFNLLYPSDQQGLFIETVRMSGAYIARNYFSNSGTVESIINVNGGNDNWTLDRNQFQKDTAGSGYRLDYQASSAHETLNQNTCTGVGTGTFTGSAPANRIKAAAANSCQ